MPVALVQDARYTIREIMFLTNQFFKTRFEYSERDILPSKIKVLTKKTYIKDREGIFEQKLEIETWSAPQYYPYIKHIKNKPVKKQLKNKHHYSVTIQLAPDELGRYSYDSKIRWRVGSFKKVPDKVSQNKVKSIFYETRKKVTAKYNKKKNITNKEKRELIKKELDIIRKKGKYLDVGDYLSQELGINLDNYYRNYYAQYLNGALYGPIYYTEPHEDNPQQIPFFCKHMIAILMVLLKKKIIVL